MHPEDVVADASLLPSGKGCQGLLTGSDPEFEGRQPAPPGGVVQRLS